MNRDEESYMIALQESLKQQELKTLQTENRLSENNSMRNDDKPNVIQYQLDLKEELERIQHLLSGHIIKYKDGGGSYWAEPEDDRLKILSDYGVKQLMNILAFYLSKNTLLSNYDEETIWWKVKDFGTEVTDLVFSRYEHFFYYPSPEELFEKYRMNAIQLGLTENELYFKCVQWSREELQSKFRHFPMIILSLIDTVHSTFLRALNGEERESLRRQVNIHESLNNNSMFNNGGQAKFSLIKPSTWK
jgi:hypothetical protein